MVCIGQQNGYENNEDGQNFIFAAQKCHGSVTNMATDFFHRIGAFVLFGYPHGLYKCKYEGD